MMAAEASASDGAPQMRMFPHKGRRLGSWAATLRGGRGGRDPGAALGVARASGFQVLGARDSPHEVGDDEKLNRSVDDPNGPALHDHRLGGLVGEEI